MCKFFTDIHMSEWRSALVGSWLSTCEAASAASRLCWTSKDLFTLFVPFGLGVRFFGDPLAIRPLNGSKWLERKTRDLTLDDTRRLF